MVQTSPEYIIAIGASAGGLEEINTFFDHTPLDGVSYVIVQHLSATFKSRMAEVLSKHSKLAVMEAKNGMAVKTNEVYLIPNNKFMTIRDGRLYLQRKGEHSGPHLTINTFFTSLAADIGARAIGVILSGLGSDGTEGARAITKAGGLILARNPENSKFDSMPSSVIAAGIADEVLEPEQMPEAIEHYVRHKNSNDSNHQANEKHLTNIIGLIKERSSLDFTDYKKSTLLRRTLRRGAQHNFESLDRYVDFLRKTPEEVDTLSKDFLISVTSFFRNSEAFDFIKTQVLPDILKNLLPGEPFKLWVAGCATGEEAYSLAISIAELEAWDSGRNPVKIFATDVDEGALMHAGKGEYAKDIENDVSPQRLEKFFTEKENRYLVSPAIRKMVIFAKHDVGKNPPYCNIDLISCRNMLIYMNPALQEKVFNMFLFGLKKNGYLFLGSSETPIPISSSLEMLHKKWRIYKNLKIRRPRSFDMLVLPDVQELKQTKSLTGDAHPATAATGLAELMLHELASQMDYLTVCLDDDNRVLKSFGDSTKFLRQENFNTNILSLMPKSLALAFSTLSARALKTGLTESVTGIPIDYIDKPAKVSVSVSPLVHTEDKQRCVMATFRLDRPTTRGRIKSPVFEEKPYYEAYTLTLETKLQEAREKLKSAYELLETTNENMHAYNEELISANEEMQSTNEEMQSVNEELHTINTDYELKNKELLELNDDLNNYFRSNLTGQLFINKELLLMRFSPGTVDQIKLRETDIGRPLDHFSNNLFRFDTMIDDIKAVIDGGMVMTKEIETKNGKWYQVMIMPYLQRDSEIAGAILTFNDITELKTLQLELSNKNQRLQLINADLENFVHTTSHDLLSPLGNVELGIAIMNQKIADPELKDYLSIINRSIKKFSALIKDIGHIANMENDPMALELVDVNETIDNIEWSLEEEIVISGAVIIRDLKVKNFLFSRNNLRSILYNLLSNALKFKSEEAPLIRIATDLDNDHLVLTVADNGIGMEPADTAKIFDLRGRLHHHIEGNGTGLYLIKRIVSATNGKIIVDTEPGKGCTFTIHLNVAKQPDHDFPESTAK